MTSNEYNKVWWPYDKPDMDSILEPCFIWMNGWLQWSKTTTTTTHVILSNQTKKNRPTFSGQLDVYIFTFLPNTIYLYVNIIFPLQWLDRNPKNKNKKKIDKQKLFFFWKNRTENYTVPCDSIQMLFNEQSNWQCVDNTYTIIIQKY